MKVKEILPLLGADSKISVVDHWSQKRLSVITFENLEKLSEEFGGYDIGVMTATGKDEVEVTVNYDVYG